MASFTAGYGPECIMSDNGAGKVRVTFPAWDFDWELYDDIAVDGSHYLYNQITTTSSAITAKGGTEDGGYYFDLGGVNFPDGNWNDTDRVVPTFQAAANDYTTITLGIAALTDNDTLIIWYADVKQNVWHNPSIPMAGKGFNVFGGLSRQRAKSISTNAVIYLTGDHSGVTPQLAIRNLTLVNSWAGFSIHVIPTAGQEGAGAIFSRIQMFSGGAAGASIAAGLTANKYEFHNILSFGHTYTGHIYMQSPVKVYYFTGVGGNVGTNNTSTASAYINCVFVQNAIADFRLMATAIVTTCASSDATGSAGLQNMTPDDTDFWAENDNGFFAPNFRILTTSSLYRAGTPVAGITKDIDGNDRHPTTPSIGAHEGTVFAYPGVYGAPDLSLKLTRS